MGPAARTLSYALAAALAAAIAAVAWIVFGPIPPIDPARFNGVTVVDRNGVVLYEPLAANGARGEWLNDIPPRIAQATIAAEDARFHSHVGIDPLATMRAAWHDVRRRALAEGGSTITQQVAKLIEPERRRGMRAKLAEAAVALRLERRYTKREILALYVNLAPYGNRINGVARASRRYFGCAPEELTVAQSAFLASLPQRPSAFNPLRDPSRAAARQRWVLGRMRKLGFIDGAQLQVALAERLHFTPEAAPLVAQHFVEHVLELARSGQTAAEEASRRVIATTLDASLQRKVQGIIGAHRRDLLAHDAHSVAVVVLDNATGGWLAWEGSGDYFGESFGGAIDGVTSLRQPGSALKPFTYAVAFEKGWSPASVLPDVPASFPTAQDGVVYTPRNYDGRYRGPMRARSALAGSENVPAVALLSRVGSPALLRLLRSSGFDDLRQTADYYGLGITLGDAEVTLAQLVGAYGAFARGGVYVRPRAIASEPLRTRRLFTPRTAFWITDVLSDPEARAFIFGSGGSLDFPFPVAVKTGTSQAYRDNWTVGYTRDVTVGVWVGNFDRRQLRGSSGVTGAGPIFHDVMLAAARAGSDAIVDPPPGLERVEVCALSGLRPSIACPATESEWLPADAPVEFCSWHRAGGEIDWPDEFRAWAGDSGQRVAAVERPRAVPARPLRVTSPPDGATYLIDPTLRAEYQALQLRAMSRGRVRWSIDGRIVGTSRADRPLPWRLEPGNHTVVATDERGNRDQVRVYVR